MILPQRSYKGLTEKTSVQAEYRYRKSERGDLRLLFFDELVRPGERRDEETNTYRLGLRHNFSQKHLILGSLIYQDVDERLNDDQFPDLIVNSINIESDESVFGPEIQYLFHSQHLRITSGVGYFEVNSEEEFNIEFSPPFGFFFDQQTFDGDVKHTNMYTYATLNELDNVTLILGASVDLFQADDPQKEDRSQINPKFGITWNPFPTMTIRAAAFRVLTRTLITDQTLEPTQVAGFNQFFDDLNSTESWQYGAGVDQKFAENLFGGLEFSKRDLEVPFLDFDFTPRIKEADWQEYLGRAYLFWTPHDWLAFKAEYGYEEAKRDREFASGTKYVNTHRIPLGIRFFHPSGFSLSLTATFFNQDGEFEPDAPETFRSGHDDFWIIDAAIGYRLPKRYGIISVGVTNLFDKEFKFEDVNNEDANITAKGQSINIPGQSINLPGQPERMIFARFTLSF